MANVLKVFRSVSIRQNRICREALVWARDIRRPRNCNRVIQYRAAFCSHKIVVSVLFVKMRSLEEDAGSAVPDQARFIETAGFYIDSLKIGTSGGDICRSIVAPKDIWIDEFSVISNGIIPSTSL